MSKKKKLKVFGNIIKYVPWVLHPFIYRPLKAIRTFLMKRGIISDAERQIQHLTFVASTLIERHYKNALLPPEKLRLHVGTTGTAANFWAQGINSSQRILEIFGDCPTKPILDWGCGSGRTFQWLLYYPNYRTYWHGCDVDRAAVGWLREKGPFKVTACNDDPPLPYSDEMFAGLFAFSVLTHIHPLKHRDWYAELRRVLEPDSRAYFTTHGAPIINDAYWIPKHFKKEFLARGYTYISHPGHYKDAAIVSKEYTSRMLKGLFVIEEYQETGYQNQDTYLIRRRD